MYLWKSLSKCVQIYIYCEYISGLLSISEIPSMLPMRHCNGRECPLLPNYCH